MRKKVVQKMELQAKQQNNKKIKENLNAHKTIQLEVN